MGAMTISAERLRELIEGWDVNHEDVSAVCRELEQARTTLEGVAKGTHVIVPRELPPMKRPMPTAVDLFDVALDGASKALPVLMTILTNAGLKEGAQVADEIAANVNCALKVYRSTFAAGEKP